jgi:hypothetical protein
MLRALRSEVSLRDRNAAFRLVLIAYALFSLLDWVTTNGSAFGSRSSLSVRSL